MPKTSVLLPVTRIRHTVSKSAPPTEAQRKERAARNSHRQEEINNAVAAWREATLNAAAELARKFDKSDRYFLDLFFQGGAHLIHKHKKVNAHNAYLHMKAEELRENGENPTLERLHSEEFKTEYNQLSLGEREEIMAHHARATSDYQRQRPTAKGRIQDVSHTMKTIQSMLKGLNVRVGIEGLLCIVRSSADYHMEPQWYFTSEALMDYMKIAVPIRKGWDIAHVGAKLEAFAIAGCDTINLHRTSKQKADEMKRQIREKIGTMLCEITGNPNAAMHYVGYEENIVQRYGVKLEGWTFDKFVNPSELSTSLPGLRKLLDAINNGTCKFVKLTGLQLKERREKLEMITEDPASVPVKTRKPRKDRGIKRKRPDDYDIDEGKAKVKVKKTISAGPITQEEIIASDLDN